MCSHFLARSRFKNSRKEESKIRKKHCSGAKNNVQQTANFTKLKKRALNTFFVTKVINPFFKYFKILINFIFFQNNC